MADETLREVCRIVRYLSETYEETLLNKSEDAPAFAFMCAPLACYYQIMLGHEVIWDSENDETYSDLDEFVILEKCQERLRDLADTFSIFDEIGQG